MKTALVCVTVVVACGQAPNPSPNTPPPSPPLTVIPQLTFEPKPAPPPLPPPRKEGKPVPITLDTPCQHMPKGWKFDELFGTILSQAAEEGEPPVTTATLRVLAWQVDVDERPLKVESALVWLAIHHTNDKDGWMLLNLYRHPDDAPPGGAPWQVSVVSDVPYKGFDAFPSTPTGADLDRFLQDSWWHFKPREGFKMTGKEVCVTSWKKSFGKAPWRSYANNK